MITVRYFLSDVCVNCLEAEAGWNEFKSRNARKAEFVEHNVSRGSIAEQYRIEGTPTWIIFNEDQEVFRLIGTDFKSLQNAFDELLAENNQETPPSAPDKPTDPNPDPPSGSKGALIGLSVLILGIILAANYE